jgi:CBS domain-containing protein
MMIAVKSRARARDIMTAGPVCASPSTSIRELARMFEEHEISGVPVTNAEGKVVGVVSKTDLIRRCSEGTDELPPAYLFEVLSDQGEEDETSEVLPEPLICVEDFMTEDPVTVSLETPAAAIAQTMSERRIHRVIVVDRDQFPLGIITSLDLLAIFPG